MQLLGFRLLLRHLFRLCLLAIDASPEGAVAPASKKARQYDLPPQQPLQPIHTCSLRCRLPPALQRHCQNPTLRLHRRNLRRRNTNRSMRRTTMISLWIHSIHCSRQILHCYLYPSTSPLLQQILTLAGQGAGHTVMFLRLQLFHIKIDLMIRHVRLDKRTLLFPNRLYLHQIRRHGLLPWRQLSFTPTLPRRMDEYKLN